VSLCVDCGEILMIETSGIRKPTPDEHVAVANNGAIQQARQLWLDARDESDQESLEIVTEFKSLLYASRTASDTQRVILTGIYWRGARAAYDTLVRIFNEENHVLPEKLVGRLELIGAVIDTGNKDAAKEICTLDSPEQRKATSVRQH
jgi:hypothetical protein